jgi:hypothetical protein
MFSSSSAWRAGAWSLCRRESVVRAILSAAAGDPGRVYHLGEAEPMLLDDLIAALCEAGEVRARVVRLPPTLVSGAGAVGSVLQKLGWRRLALTADKSRELLAKHWTARTSDSLEALGLQAVMPWTTGAAMSWAWYRNRGWLRSS